MGYDAGFDMIPPLSKGFVDRYNWDRFMDRIKDHYKDDAQVEMKPNYLKAGEHPMLPLEGNKLLRFSAKISGSIAATTGVEHYIDTVTRIAKDHFGRRVWYWNELYDRYGEYNWDEVNDSFKSYEKEDAVSDHASTSPSVSELKSNKEEGIPVFEVKELPGKGRGLIACVDIAPGTRILCEKPLLTAGAHPMSVEKLEKVFAAKLRALPKPSQRQFLSLHNNHPGKFPFSNTFRTNALPCGPDSPEGGVYPTVCFINHSCIPNAHNNWNPKAEHETIHAIRPIRAGEEIMIAYDRGGPLDVRRAFLQKSFGFECVIEKLDITIGDPMHMIAMPDKSLGACRSLLMALDCENAGYAGILNSRVYYDAFQVCIAHGDQARASVFAERSYETRVLCEGMTLQRQRGRKLLRYGL
ncbi:hypothetical protein HBI60_255450 [Parastagonospora nodorum]|nr:hypothetical protein HBI60_255450 [Parastagonospora nodorum]